MNKVVIFYDNTDVKLEVEKKLSSIDNCVFYNIEKLNFSELDEIEPVVMVLALKSVAKAQELYLEINKKCVKRDLSLDRVIMLASSENLDKVIDLCNRDIFDEYTLFWPSYDHARLRYCVTAMLGYITLSKDNFNCKNKLSSMCTSLHEGKIALEELLQNEALDPKQTRQVFHQLHSYLANLVDGEQEDIQQQLYKEVNKTHQQIDTKLASLRTGVQSALDVQTQSYNETHALLSSNDLKIVILSDNEDYRVRLTAVLKADGYKVVEARSCAQLIDVINKLKFELAIVDFNLLHENSLEILNYLYEKHNDLPIVVVADSASKDVVYLCLKKNISDFILKSVPLEVILQKINHILNQCVA